MVQIFLRQTVQETVNRESPGLQQDRFMTLGDNQTSVHICNLPLGWTTSRTRDFLESSKEGVFQGSLDNAIPPRKRSRSRSDVVEPMTKKLVKIFTRSVETVGRGSPGLQHDEMMTQGDNRTSVRICNLPLDWTTTSTKVFLESLDQGVFQGTFDFLHVPRDPRTAKVLGQAYVNFKRHHTAENFIMRLHKTKQRAQRVKLTWSKRQGFAAQLRSVQNLLRDPTVPICHRPYLETKAHLPAKWTQFLKSRHGDL